MNNYEYIIAGLPVLSGDAGSIRELDTDGIIADIREQCSAADNETISLLLESYAPDKPDRAFYDAALKHRNAFIRDYFLFDLGVRNAKVEYLNRELGRAEGTDCLHLTEDGDESGSLAEVDGILDTSDILERERGLDRLMWDKAEELTVMHVFDLDVILAFIVRLKSIDRWLKLDPETGRALFRKLVEEIRNNR